MMSYIKFYPQRLALWEAAGALTVTDEESGFEKEFMLDTRKVTYWQSDDASGNKYVQIDLGATASIDSWCLFYYGGGDSHSVELLADTASNYATEDLIDSYAVGTGEWGKIVRAFTEETTYRYWRIRFYNLSAAVKVSQFYLGLEYEISVNFNYGDEIGIDYSGVKLKESLAGVRSAEVGTPARKYWHVNWDILDETNKEKFDSVMAITNGAQYPLFFVDSDGVNNFVRIVNRKLGARRHHDAQYNIPSFLVQDELGDPN